MRLFSVYLIFYRNVLKTGQTRLIVVCNLVLTRKTLKIEGHWGIFRKEKRNKPKTWAKVADGLVGAVVKNYNATVFHTYIYIAIT